jgi:colicin import membrane protein
MRHTTIIVVRASKKPSKQKPKKKRTSSAHNPPAPELSKPKRAKKKPSQPPVDLGPPGRSGWRELYATTCGPERDELRKKAGETNAASRTAVTAAVKADRAAARKAAREAAAAAARPAKRRRKAKTQAAKIVSAAEAPCDDAKRALVLRTERDKRRRSETRTPKQRQAGRRALERHDERVEEEANAVEAAVRSDPSEGAMARFARREFLRDAKRYFSAARKETAKHPAFTTTPTELFMEDFEKDVGEMRRRFRKEAEKSDAEYSAEQEAYYRSLEEDQEC